MAEKGIPNRETFFLDGDFGSERMIRREIFNAGFRARGGLVSPLEAAELKPDADAGRSIHDSTALLP